MGFKYDFVSVEGQKPTVSFDVASYEINEVTPDELLRNKVLESRLIDLFFQLDDAEKVYDKNVGVHMNDKITREGIALMFQRKDMLFTIGSGADVAGFACVDQRTEFKNVVYISSVVVDKTLRGKGLGKKLMTAILERYKNKSAALSVSAYNPHGISLYKSLGFTPMSIRMIRK